MNSSLINWQADSRLRDVVWLLLVLLLLSSLASCASKSASTVSRSEFERETVAGSSKSLNDKIMGAAVVAQKASNDAVYYLGVGDVLELRVFQVEALNATLRVDGKGQVILPLLGTIDVAGLSVSQAEKLIAERLSEQYLQDPQISLFVSEYRSQQITVMGSVSKPNIYNVQRPRTVIEMLLLAGGLTDNAADTLRVTYSQVDPESGDKIQSNLLLNVGSLVADQEAMTKIRLHGGDAIFVPEAGVVYVEGAVEKPGAYKMTGSVNVMQAVLMAGGTPWTANLSRARVIRQIGSKPVSLDINLEKIREQKDNDVILQDGDIVIVAHSGAKRVVSGFFRGVTSIVGFGYNLNQ